MQKMYRANKRLRHNLHIIHEDMQELQRQLRSRSVYAVKKAYHARRPKHTKQWYEEFMI